MEICNHSHQGEEEEEEDQSTIIISGEEDRDHESKDLLGVGRPHECVYCKRGFNSAQALGGHMNIHRKDRAKINKPSVHEEHTPGSSIYYQNLSPQSHEHHHHQLGMINCGTYLPPESKSLTPSCCNDFHQPPIDSKRTSLSLESPSKDLKRSDKPAINNSGDELDLELRLGYDS